MEKKKVLIVTQEMEPYITNTEISAISRKLPQHIQESGMEIRVLMPRFGVINERRHRLHEVVRLSGMNIIVDDDDYPLIIKVASLPGARMQVYFLDNDEFFKRKSIFKDDSGKPYIDNADRMVFFCKGVIETVKKFGWPPDIVHCHGWMTSLIPLYLKTAYKTEPLFQNSKVVYSLYDNGLDKGLDEQFLSKASINNLTPDDLKAYYGSGGATLNQGAVEYSDAVIVGSESITENAMQLVNNGDKPLLQFSDAEGFEETYMEFYNNLLAEAEV